MAAAAAVSLHDQTQRLTGMVSVFKVGASGHALAYSEPALHA